MEHTLIVRKKFESELGQLPIFENAHGAALTSTHKKYRFAFELIELQEHAVHYHVVRLGDIGHTRVGNGQLDLRFSRDQDDRLFQPELRVVVPVVTIRGFSPVSQLPKEPQPAAEARVFGKSRLDHDHKAQSDDVTHDTAVFCLALNQIMGAIERAVVS